MFEEGMSLYPIQAKICNMKEWLRVYAHRPHRSSRQRFLVLCEDILNTNRTHGHYDLNVMSEG